MKNLWLAALVMWLGSCAFEPDLSRFEPCTEAGQCPTGFLCLTEAQRCVPECGENCSPSRDGGADAGADGGTDAGTDAGVDAGQVDAGVADSGVEDAGPALALAAIALAPAIETQPWAHTFMPTGGVPGSGYRFSMDGGVPGFTLTFAGTLSSPGAPDAGTFPFSITVEDNATPVRGEVTTQFSLEVRPLLRVANSVLVEGRQGQAYSEQLSATGGQPPYTWVLDGGMAPGGLSLTDGGLLSGQPNVSGMFSFGVSVSDSASPPQQASRLVNMETKLLGDLTLYIATRAAVDGRVGTAYFQPLKTYSGNANAVVWSLLNGAFPGGVMLTNTPTTPPAWQLTGTPTDAGVSNFTLRCTDGISTLNLPMTITVY